MSFSRIITQEGAKDIITGQLRSGRIPHAYLFLGEDGVGRRLTAMELAKALNCMKTPQGQVAVDACDHCPSCRKIDEGIHPDVQRIDFAWQARLEDKELEKQKAIKIDTIRALQRDINLKSTEGAWKVYLIEPAEKITPDAANCLLKTLEEPPARTVIILLARHKENLPATIVSRTQVVYFRPIPEHHIAEYLMRAAKTGPDEAKTIARISEGSISAALRLKEERNVLGDSLWQQLKNPGLATADLLGMSQNASREAAKALDELLAEAKLDFRSDPERYGDALSSVLESRRMVEANVNPQMILDVLLLRLYEGFAVAGSERRS